MQCCILFIVGFNIHHAFLKRQSSSHLRRVYRNEAIFMGAVMKWWSQHLGDVTNKPAQRSCQHQASFRRCHHHSWSWKKKQVSGLDEGGSPRAGLMLATSPELATWWQLPLSWLNHDSFPRAGLIIEASLSCLFERSMHQAALFKPAHQSNKLGESTTIKLAWRKLPQPCQLGGSCLNHVLQSNETFIKMTASLKMGLWWKLPPSLLYAGNIPKLA